jgi:hypothetical protein
MVLVWLRRIKQLLLHPERFLLSLLLQEPGLSMLQPNGLMSIYLVEELVVPQEDEELQLLQVVVVVVLMDLQPLPELRPKRLMLPEKP